MKIVYLHQYFRTPQMNGGTRSYEMARRWVAKGHEVHVVTSDASRSSGGWRTYEVAGIVVHACPVPYSNSMPFRHRISAFVRFGLSASIRARMLAGDVVFATSTPLTIVVPGLYATSLRKAPLVFEVRDLWPELPVAIGALRNPVAIALGRTLEWLAYRRARKIVALSPGMADGVIARGIPDSKVVVAPNSCDVDEFSVPASVGQTFRTANSWLGERPLIVYCGTLGRMNNVGYLVDVAHAMSEIDPEIAFGIFGTGAEQSAIRQRASSLGVLNKNLFMPGEVRKDQVPAILSASTVCTSLFLPLKAMEANSANKFFDALAAGRPIAINYGGWQADLIRRTGAGIVVDHVCARTAAHQLHELVRDPEGRFRAHNAALQLAQHEFARDRISDLVLEATVSAVDRLQPSATSISPLR